MALHHRLAGRVGKVFFLPTDSEQVGNKKTLPTLHKILNLMALHHRLGGQEKNFAHPTF